jgi:hypothetical protein
MSNQTPTDLEPQKQKLVSELNQFVETYQKRHRGNFHLNWILILTGLLLSAGVTISGMLNQGMIAALLGICIGFLFGVQNAFPLGEKAEFYRLMVTEGQNLISILDYEVDTSKEFEDCQKRFRKLRSHAAMSLPKGRGMDAVKEMYKDISRKDAV